MNNKKPGNELLDTLRKFHFAILEIRTHLEAGEKYSKFKHELESLENRLKETIDILEEKSEQTTYPSENLKNVSSVPNILDKSIKGIKDLTEFLPNLIKKGKSN